jgi:hypothetical protein
MGRILYIVAPEQPLLRGYLMAKVDARSPEGHRVEIKLDERRGERRRQGEGRDPERRRGERRRHPSLEGELRSRGFATVVQHEAGQSLPGVPMAESTLGWRPRSTRGQRAARAWRRKGPRWALRAALLLTAIGLSIAVGRFVHSTANRPDSMGGASPREPAPQVEGEAPLPSAPPIEPAAPPPRTTPTPPSSRTPMRIVPTRASGVVLSVDLKARTLLLEDMGAAAAGARRVRINLAPDTRVTRSEREPKAADPSYPFKDTAISLSDIQVGDFVVVEIGGSAETPRARSVVVTLPKRPVK